MKTITILLLLLLASTASANEFPIGLDGAISYGCHQAPVWIYGVGAVSVSNGRCRVEVEGLDNLGGAWFGSEWQAAFDLVSSSCDSVTATFWYMDRGLTWRAVRLIPATTGRGAASYRSPVLPGLLYPGHLEISGYGRSVNFNVAHARLEWQYGLVNKRDQPSTWGAIKRGMMP